ncbi:4-aminobutyrate transaminase [Sporothrix bragantina]|uniref:4-aminobutyrate transaminase n=1 Tax=Sporothrix bragantina TaxID=671064 RepID=A0ABP0D1C4_9PEZI
MTKLLYLSLFSASLAAAANVTLTSTGCADPSGFEDCQNKVNDGTSSCITQADRDGSDIELLACGCQDYVGNYNCYAAFCWNRVWECEYQEYIVSYLANCPTGKLPVPYFPAPDNAPDACSCNLGKVYQAVTDVITETTTCTNNADSADAESNVQQMQGCNCCEISGAFSSIIEICPNTDPSIVGLSTVQKLETELNTPFDSCGEYLDTYDCVSSLSYSLDGVSTFYKPTDSVTTGTATLSNEGGTVTAPASGATFTYTNGGDGVVYTITAVSAGAAVTGAASGTTGSGSGGDTTGTAAQASKTASKSGSYSPRTATSNTYGDTNILEILITSIPFGYNNLALARIASSPQMISGIISGPALGNFPLKDWHETLTGGLLRAAPQGLDQVFTATTGSDANETAYKAAFIWQAAQQQRGAPFSLKEIESVIHNQTPGAPHRSIPSFAGGFHGRLFGSLSTMRSKPIHKLDIPAFDWPVAPFPQLRYPLSAHVAQTHAEEQRCLEATARIIDACPSPVASVAVEPIQSEGRDNHAYPAFFQGLRQLTLEKGVLPIVDEVQTGAGATGRFWAHEHWGLETPPDMVTFSKKAQAAGFYYRDPSLRPGQPYRQFNTWMGDPVRALLLRGTFLAWDSPRRDDLVKQAKAKGVNIGGCGEQMIRLRPMLILEQKHGTSVCLFVSSVPTTA